MIFKYFSQEFANDALDLVNQNGFYLYEYMSDFKKFKEEFPGKEKFYNSLTDRKISYKEYEHVLNVSKKFLMKTMNYYHNLHLKCEVLLLADVFKKFRNNNLNNYGLCPSHYLSAPGFSWDTMLKITKIELELTPGADTYLLFEKGTRNGFSYISNRYSKANKKYT